MADVALLFNVLVRDNTGAGLNSASSRMEKFRAATSIAAVGAVGALAAVGKASVDAAATQSANFSKYEQITKNTMDASAQATARSLNLSQASYADYYAQLSAMYQSNGIGVQKANQMAAESMTTAADAAAFGNTTVGEAVEAQLGLLKGSGELWEKYSVSIKASDISARMKAEGTDKLTGAEKKAAEAATRHALAQEKAKIFLGQAAKESGSLESRNQRLAATVEDLKARLGAALLPTVEQFIGKLQSMANWVEQNQTKAKLIVTVLVTLAGVIITAAIAIKAYAAAMMVAKVATAVWTGAMWLLNAAFLANPIVGVTVLIVALVAAIVLIATKTKWFQKIWAVAWGAIKAAASAVWNWLKSAAAAVFGFLRSLVGGFVSVYVGAFNKVRAAVSAAWSGIKSATSSAVGFIVGKAGEIVGFFKSIPGRIGDLGGLLYQKGVDLIQGLVNGIKSMAMAPVNAVRDITSGLANVGGKALGKLGFGSPSRVYRKYGRWLIDGMALGVKDRKKKVAAEMAKVSASLAKIADVKERRRKTLEAMAKINAGIDEAQAKKVDDSMSKMADRISKVIDKMKAVKERAQGIANGIKDSFRSMADFSGLDPNDGTDLLQVMLEKAKKAEAFTRGITALRKRGLNATALEQLTAAGPDQGAAMVERLLMRNTDIGGINGAMARIAAAGATLGNREAYARTGVSPDMAGRAVIGKGKQKVVIDLNLNGEADALTDAIIRAIRKKVRTSGGDVDLVLGTRKRG